MIQLKYQKLFKLFNYNKTNLSNRSSVHQMRGSWDFRPDTDDLSILPVPLTRL